MQAAAQPPPPLPAIRSDLMLIAAGRHDDGTARFVVHDPLKNRYLALGAQAALLFRHWQPLSPQALRESLAHNGVRPPEEADLVEFAKFLFANNLSVEPPGGDPQMYLAKPKTMAAGPLARTFNSTLFLRYPLFSPQPLLDRMAPVAHVLFSGTTLCVLLTIALADVYLVSRQWEAFTTTFFQWGSPGALALLAAGMFVLKIIHELGHALAATKLGIKVPSAGIAVMLLVPMAYTDTSASWRLSEPRQRLLIDSAGILAELAVALIATFLWVFMEDGPVRSMMFTLATAAWIMGIAINLNPLMKFDGYHMLCSITGIENLQDRSLAMARWQFRKWLFGLGEKPPEFLPDRMRLIWVGFATATIVYRVVLQIGIATILYFLAPKAVAVPLAGFALLLGLGLPLHKELAGWWKDRQAISGTGSSRRTLFTALAILAFMLVPLPVRVQIPAILHSAAEANIFTGENGRVVSVMLASGKQVKTGEVLLTLESPEIEHELRLAKIRSEAIAARLRRAGADSRDLALSLVLARENQAAKAAITALEARLGRLVVRSPKDGIVGNMDAVLAEGQWLSASHPVAIIQDPATVTLSGLLSEHDAPRVVAGNSGKFVPDNALFPSLEVVLETISAMPAAGFASRELADTQGGLVPVAVSTGRTEETSPHGSWFPVSLTPRQSVSHHLPGQTVRGVVILHAGFESVVTHAFRRVASTLIRESGI